MIAFALAELQDWRSRRMARMVSYSVIGAALAAIQGPLHPLFVSLACTAAAVFAGWAEGNRIRTGDAGEPAAFPLRLDAKSAAGGRLTVVDILAGKLLSLLAVWAALTIVLSPLIAATAIAWGFRGALVVSCLLCWLASFIASGSAGFLCSLVCPRLEGMPGLFVLTIWIGLEIYREGFTVMTPFRQTVELFKSERYVDVYIAMGGEALIALICFAVSGLVLGGARKRPHG